MRCITGLMLIGAVLLVCGCLRRLEVVALMPDGSARMMVIVSGGEEDYRNGDAMPSEETGWRMVENVEEKDDGEDEITAMGFRDLEAGEPFPESYAAPGSREERKSLRFATTTKVEHRSDGTYYHLKRTYFGRRTAEIDHLRSEILESDDMKKVSEKDPEKLSPEQRKQFALALIAFEREKTKVFIDQAASALGDALPQDVWLKARDLAGVVYDSPELKQQAVELLQQEMSRKKNEFEGQASLFNSEEKETAEDVVRQGAGIKDFERQLLLKVEEAITSVLVVHGLTRSKVDRMIDAYRMARETFEITEDLGDEEIEFEAILPGTIITHNSQKDPETVGIRSRAPDQKDYLPVKLRKDAQDWMAALRDRPFDMVAWEVKGDELHDRDVVMMATSFVPGGDDE